MLDFLHSILYNNNVSCTGFMILIAAIYLANRSDPVQLTQGESPFFIEGREMVNHEHSKPAHNEHLFIEDIKNGFLEIDDKCRIWRTAKKVNDKKIKLYPKREMVYKNKDGYIVLSSYTNGKAYSCRSHRIIWIYFNGDIPDNLQINHKNGIKTDNSLTNLELVTQRQNSRHAVNMGLQKYKKGENNPISKLTNHDITGIRKCAKSMTQREIAKMFNISQAMVNNIINKKRWAHI